VARSIRSAEALTRQILDFSQRQGGEREARYEAGSAVDLNALIIQLGPELCRLVSPENCFELILCENETAVRADAKHIQQIVTDFVIQARGFGGGTNKIELATAVDPSEPSASGGVQSGSFVSLSVTGRPSADGTRDDSATPLPWTGVATSQAILAQYGGTMTSTVEAATAEFGAGIRFSLYLRRVNGGQHPLRTIETAAGEHGGFTDAGTVLLVEEEPLIRELSRDMLERQGFRVLTAGNAGEAERLARGPGHIDVLITEWAEDGDQGGALVRRLREMRPELHVLYMVGHSQESTDQIPGSDGIAVVQKPFSGDALGRKIRQLLRPKSES
jgi:CheY-like chemotaxis protein